MPLPLALPLEVLCGPQEAPTVWILPTNPNVLESSGLEYAQNPH